MSEEDETTEGYPVGYGKPPKHAQWKPGQSGNPSGKKSKEATLRDKLLKIAGEEIIVSKNGTAVAMSNEEAMLYTAFHKAQSGNPQFFKILLQELGSDAATLLVPPPFEVSEADLSVLQTHADWIGLVEASKVDKAAAAQPDPGTQPGSQPVTEGDSDADDPADDA